MYGVGVGLGLNMGTGMVTGGGGKGYGYSYRKHFDEGGISRSAVLEDFRLNSKQKRPEIKVRCR